MDTRQSHCLDAFRHHKIWCAEVLVTKKQKRETALDLSLVQKLGAHMEGVAAQTPERRVALL